MNDGFLMHLACLSNPDQTTPWLAYADWLDDHGTSDRDRAHSEWIRLTNVKLRKGITRQAGEPDWIINNASRLWPSLTSLSVSKFGTALSLESGRIRFKIPVMCKNSRVLRSHMVVHVRRGVAREISVPYSRCVSFLKDAVLDEPYAPLSLISMPPGAMVMSNWDRFPTLTQVKQGEISVYYSPFHAYGLGDVWRGIEGWTEEIRGTRDAHMRRVFSSQFHGPQFRSVAIKAVNASLTRYARQLAGVPHMVAPLTEVG